MNTHFPHLINLLGSRAAPPSAGDAELLACYADQRDERAFAALVHRHGPMVWRVCRRVLGDHHAAEDAFQATFLVLARRAAALRQPARLTGWLYGVALRVARKALTVAVLRQPRPVAVSPEPPAPGRGPLAEVAGRELLTALDEEVELLPEAYRLPVLLCALEGVPQEEAARRLGWTPGSVKGRLERGRRRLHERLARRGLTLAAALAAAQAAPGAAAVPAALAAATAPAVLAATAGQGAGGVSAVALRLAQGVGASAPSRVVLGLLVLVFSAAGVGWLIAGGPATPPKGGAAGKQAAAANQGQRPRSLPPEVVAAWRQAGARVGWMSPDRVTVFAKLNQVAAAEPGWVPAFAFDQWPEGGIGKLPQPPHGFGLFLFGTNVSDAALKELAGLKTLRALELGSSDVTDAGVKELAQLPALEALGLRTAHNLTATGLKELAGCKALRHLDLGNTNVTDEVLQGLTRLRSLRGLNLDATPVTGAGLKELARLTALEDLSLVAVRVTDAEVRDIARLKSLRGLSLDGTGVTDAGLKDLAGLPALWRLSLSRTEVTGAGVAALARLPSLRSLDLARSKVSDAGLKGVAALKALEDLALDGTPVTDRGLCADPADGAPRAQSH